MTIENLEALERAATAGPWKWNHDELNARYKKRDGRRRKNNQLVFSLDGPKHNPDMIEGAADAYDYQSVMRLWWHSVKGTSIVNANPSPKDAELIVAARNALPALLAVAKAAKARLDAWDAAVADPNAACYQCEDDEQIKRERAALAQLEAKP